MCKLWWWGTYYRNDQIITSLTTKLKPRLSTSISGSHFSVSATSAVGDPPGGPVIGIIEMTCWASSSSSCENISLRSTSSLCNHRLKLLNNLEGWLQFIWNYFTCSFCFLVILDISRLSNSWHHNISKSLQTSFFHSWCFHVFYEEKMCVLWCVEDCGNLLESFMQNLGLV